MKKIPGGMPNMGNMGNMGNMIRQAQKLQQDMLTAQQEIAEKEFTVSAGGGAVSIQINGKKQITSLTIAPEVVDPDDIETLTDILTAGFNEAIRVVDDYSAEQMKKFTGGMGMPGLF